ncbi:MAG: hypothetical protein KF690_05520 [Bacteroidetes bacterium]|nr:hypothetical protein [Bacteroidota bacterium]
MLRRLRFLQYFLITFLLWVAIRLVNDYTTTLQVPVKYVNIPGRMKLTEELPEHLTMSIKGRGQDILLPYLNIYLDTLHIDMKDALRRNYLVTNNLKEIFKSQLPESFSVLNVHPDTIPVFFIEKITKKVPVTPQVRLKMDAGFLVFRQLRLEPDSIVLTGTEQDLRYIHSWPTEDFALENVHETGSSLVPLKASTDLLLSHPTTKVFYRVERYTEVSRKIDIQVVGLNERQVRILPKRVTVSYLVPLDRYEELSTVPLTVQLNARDMHPEANLVAPTVPQVPEGIHRLRISPRHVRFVRTLGAQ